MEIRKQACSGSRVHNRDSRRLLVHEMLEARRLGKEASVQLVDILVDTA